MAYEFYVSVKGKKQGQFPGESPRKAYDTKIPCLAFDYAIESPRDAHTGQASGKRQHRPVQITKEWGKTSPMFFQALVNNEALDEIKMEFVKTDPKGAEIVHYQITLTNATVSSLHQFVESVRREATGGSGPATLMELEEISFTFDKIELEDILGKTMGNDSWTQS